MNNNKSLQATRTIKATRTQIAKRIYRTNGKIFRTTFIKKDGSERQMVCRLGVSKGVNGVGRKFDPADYKLIGVFDMVADGFRMININTIISASIEGKQYEVAA